jgi:hypothetical protein
MVFAAIPERFGDSQVFTRVGSECVDGEATEKVGTIYKSYGAPCEFAAGVFGYY